MSMMFVKKQKAFPDGDRITHTHGAHVREVLFRRDTATHDCFTLKEQGERCDRLPVVFCTGLRTRTRTRTRTHHARRSFNHVAKKGGTFFVQKKRKNKKG